MMKMTRTRLVLATGLALTGAVAANLGPALAGMKPMTEECGMNPVAQSICVYELILDDIRDHYPLRGGGGISAIVQSSTTLFTARLEQEGRVDLRNYEITFDADGTPHIAGVTEGTETP